MRSKFKWIFTLLVAFTMQFSFAQEKTVTGVVSDELGPIAGANVVVEGTTRGTTTDFDGNYTIKAKQGEVLVISYTGKKTTKITVAAASAYNVSLKDDVVVGQEVVVVGYGTTTKEAFVGTATSVKTANVEAKAVSNVSQALKGEVAGVNVITTSGQPGTFATIRIRGFGSVNGNRDPLYVVDGVPMSEDNMNSVNPSDIESLTVLKDAAATAVYGSRGANGVIVIATKTGKKERSSISVDLRTSVNMALLPRYSVIESPEEYIGLSWEALYNRGVATAQPDPVAFANNTLFSGGGISPGYNMWNVADGGDLIDPVTRTVRPGVTRKYSPEDWEDYGFQTSYRQEANVRFSGSNDKTNYFSSFGYLNDEGYIINSDYKRYTARLNVNHKPAEWLRAGANIGYSGSKTNNNGQSADSGSIFWFVDNIPSIYPLFARDVDGNMIPDPYFGGYQYDYGDGTSGARAFGGLTNAIADAHYDRSVTNRHELTGNFSFDVNFTKNLTLETRYGAQFYDNEYNNRNNPFYGSAAQQYGSLFKQQSRLLRQNFLQLLRYRNSFGNHNVELFGAHESNSFKQNIFSASKFGAVLIDTYDLNQYINVSSPPESWTNTSNLESYFGQFNYNYAGKYYFTASARRDGSSRFKNDKWGNFGSIGASWIVSKESFMEKASFINNLKLKASYGLMGDQEGVGFYSGYDTFSIGNLNNEYSISIRDNGNPSLTWEKSKIFQVGIETKFFNFLSLNVDFYEKNTYDLFFERRVAPSTGIAIITVNDGELTNRGVEFDLNAELIKGKNKGDFTLDFGINGELLTNKLTKMPIDPATGEERLIDVSNAPYGWANGKSVYDFYMREWAGVDPATGVGMWYMNYDDINANGIYDAGDVIIRSLTDYLGTNSDAIVGQTTTTAYADATQRFVGKSAIPKVRGAFRLNASYKNFDLSTQFTYSIGGYAYDGAYAGLMGNGSLGQNNWHTDIRGRWQEPGDITNIPRLSAAADANVNAQSTRFLTKADYLGMNNVRLGYTMPSTFTDRLNISNFNIYVTGDNLFFFSKRDGFNPSTSENGSSNTYRYSPLSTFSLGVKLEF
ncbi:TonB-linked SusC/RagA family outer membrane protein [Flavobacterium aquaticum]|uniref:TonB-linked SusC/RagA family outer membrane protein n=1 Tax=Flavobacterium aquaticum TaxID=1236486 RepID=A0A327YGN0_9FLAO|nr:SusC/RagA family TonB-linked outer membrane protein [Flavobacterium aquaticum]RAK20130.1 TonB-linked SusC/RagA family outer membrane protein [Flavobacterium aquaticum]